MGTWDILLHSIRLSSSWLAGLARHLSSVAGLLAYPPGPNNHPVAQTQVGVALLEGSDNKRYISSLLPLVRFDGKSFDAAEFTSCYGLTACWPRV